MKKKNQETEEPLHTKIKVLLSLFWERAEAFFIKIKLHRRKNLLSTFDIFKAYLKLRKGDVVLTGNFKSPKNMIIPGALSHASLYIGRGKIIQAIWTGVEYNSVRHLLKESDTLVILRLPRRTKHKRQIIKLAITYAKQQLGKPYENFFREDKKQFFCTELVNESFKNAGYKTKLQSIKPFRTSFDKISKHILDVTHWLTPIEFLNGNFRIVFLSHNLMYNGKEILIRADTLPKNL